MAAIELDGLERRYGERVALAGVSARVEAGQTLAVLGGNGAGKTTLLRVLAGLLRPTAAPCASSTPICPGSAGSCPAGSATSATTRCSTATSPVARTSATTPGSTACPRRASARVLGQVGMERRADDPIRELSRGMVQRVAVARAVLHEPPLLLLDEPRANLDPAAAELLEPLIGRASGRTRVLVSHDVAGALAEADVVLRLRRAGRWPRTRSSTGDPRRRDDPAQGPAAGAAHQGGGAGHDPVHDHRLRPVPLRPRSQRARRRPGLRRPVGHAAAGRGDRRDPPVRRRARAGRHRRAAARPRRPHRAVRRQGERAVPVPRRGRAGRAARLRPAAARSRPRRHAAGAPARSCCSATSASPRSARWSPRSPPRRARAS